MTNGHNVPPDHPASQSDDGSYKGEEHSILDGPDSDANPHHVEHRDPLTVKEAMMDDEAVVASGFEGSADHSHVYHRMMDIGFGVGLPLGCAVVMFVSLILLSTSFIVSLFLSFLTWLGVYAIAKTFFIHDHAEGGTH